MKQTASDESRRLIELARDAERRGDTAKAFGYYDDATETLEREQEASALAEALRWKGTLHREQGETEAAYRCYKKSLSYAVRCGSVSCKAHCYNCLAIVAQRRGNLNECERLYMHAA